MKVTYYRLWPGDMDTGHWDTDVIDIPDDTPSDKVETVTRELLKASDWAAGVEPVAFGVYRIEGQAAPESKVEIEVYDIQWPTENDNDLPTKDLLKVPSSMFNEAIEAGNLEGFIHESLVLRYEEEPHGFDYAV